MSFTFKHPKYYTELRKRNRDLSELQRVKPNAQSHNRIRPLATTTRRSLRACVLVRASSPKLQASSLKLQAQIKKNNKHQAPSSKLQAASHKLQAP